MSKNRFGKTYANLNKNQKMNLTNGPGKLSMALNIDKTLDKEDLCKTNCIWKREMMIKLILLKLPGLE